MCLNTIYWIIYTFLIECNYANFIMYDIHTKISALPIVFQSSVCLVFYQYYWRERKMKHKTGISNLDNQPQTLKLMDIINKLWIALRNKSFQFWLCLSFAISPDPQKALTSW